MLLLYRQSKVKPVVLYYVLSYYAVLYCVVRISIIADSALFFLFFILYFCTFSIFVLFLIITFYLFFRYFLCWNKLNTHWRHKISKQNNFLQQLTWRSIQTDIGSTVCYFSMIIGDINTMWIELNRATVALSEKAQCILSHHIHHWWQQHSIHYKTA